MYVSEFDKLINFIVIHILGELRLEDFLVTMIPHRDVWLDMCHDIREQQCF